MDLKSCKTSEECVEMVIPWQICRTTGPLTFHSQEMEGPFLKGPSKIFTEVLGLQGFKDQSGIQRFWKDFKNFPWVGHPKLGQKSVPFKFIVIYCWFPRSSQSCCTRCVCCVNIWDCWGVTYGNAVPSNRNILSKISPHHTIVMLNWSIWKWPSFCTIPDRSRVYLQGSGVYTASTLQAKQWSCSVHWPCSVL